MLRDLNAYRTQNRDKNRSRKETLNNAYKLLRGREINIDTFKDGFFHCLKCRHYFKNKNERRWQRINSLRRKTKYTANDFNKLIVEKEKSINMELLQKHFKFPSPSLVLNTLYNVHNKERNNEFVNMIEIGWVI